MNIAPANNNNTFKGTLIVNNLKKNTSFSLLTTKEMDKQIYDKFLQTVGDSSLTFSSPQKCLTNLKEYLKAIAQITTLKIDKLKLPAGDDLAVIYNSSKNKTQIDVPEYFSITHISK